MFSWSLTGGATADGPEVDTRIGMRADKFDTIILPGERLQRLQQTDRQTHKYDIKHANKR